ncbi:hypothetical protein [Arvimicrobium flavum]|uniref:hypothetical protein n=1 Tax=Arvimicrobium flavum TaxID=3393320 RepID=UPI00237AF002|nr:hypothetical protein [Mesorhizobium shangrilense]
MATTVDVTRRHSPDGGVPVPPSDRGERELLPPERSHDATIRAAETDTGDHAAAREAPSAVHQDMGRPAADAATPPSGWTVVDDGGERAEADLVSGVFQPAATPRAFDAHESGPPPLFDTLEVTWRVPLQESPAASPGPRAEAPAAPSRDGGTEGAPEATHPNPASARAEDGEARDGHSVTVTQDAVVEQDAALFVSGYVGEVVARLHIDQSLVMLQNVDISFTIDGDGRFSIRLDQDMTIDQAIDIHLSIFDADGVLYVDLFLRDSIVVEQETFADIEIGDGIAGGDVVIDQHLTLDQDVDIEVDIEDELEERYAVTVTIDVAQTIDADQDAIIGITSQDDQLDIDVDAAQSAMIEQDTIVHADFVLI